MTTEEDFWVDLHGSRARWRTATRKPSRCGNQGTRPFGCETTNEKGAVAIGVGDRYFDTGEADGTVGPWATVHLCAGCATRKSSYVRPYGMVQP